MGRTPHSEPSVRTCRSGANAAGDGWYADGRLRIRFRLNSAAARPTEVDFKTDRTSRMSLTTMHALSPPGSRLSALGTTNRPPHLPQAARTRHGTDRGDAGRVCVNAPDIGRAHVRTPVTHAPLVC